MATLPDTRTPRAEFFDPTTDTFVVVQGIPYDGELTAVQLRSRKFVRHKLAPDVVPVDVGHGFVLLSNGIVLGRMLQRVSAAYGAVAITSRGCVLTVGRDSIAKQIPYLSRVTCVKARFRWPEGYRAAPESSGAWAISADHRSVALIADDGVLRTWTFTGTSEYWPLRTNPGTIQSFRSRGLNAVIGDIEAIGLVYKGSPAIITRPKPGLGVLDAALLPDGRVVFGATDETGHAFLGVDDGERKGGYVAVADWRRIDVARFVNGPKDSVLDEGVGGVVYKVAPTCSK